MVHAIIDYKRQVYFCNAVYEKFTKVITVVRHWYMSNQEMYTLDTTDK